MIGAVVTRGFSNGVYLAGPWLIATAGYGQVIVTLTAGLFGQVPFDETFKPSFIE
jgi:hypothetical protein